MWLFKNKKNKAVKNWHYKAMIINPSETTITIIGAEAEEPYYFGEEAGTAIQLWHPTAILPVQQA